VKTLQRAKKQKGFVTGHDFSRAANASKSTRALAPEGCFSCLAQNLAFFPYLFRRVLLQIVF
jgi:hypothetical protein